MRGGSLKAKQTPLISFAGVAERSNAVDETTETQDRAYCKSAIGDLLT